MEQTKTISAGTFGIEQSVAVQAMWIVAFSALTAVGAQIEIPHQPVPYTMQTLFVLLSGALLGKRNGALSQLLYLFIGAVGLPVFSGFGFGVARLLGPTGGYLLSFPVAAFTVGYLISMNKHRVYPPSFWRAWSLLSMVIGLFIVFSLGTLQLNFVYFHNWSDAFRNGFLIFSWWDIVKLTAATVIYNRINAK